MLNHTFEELEERAYLEQNGLALALIEKFYEWAKKVKEDGHTVLVSEYEHNVPDGWDIVWRHESRKSIRNKEGVQERTVEILMCPN